jgi:low affinity Fe/Cu permease
MVFLIQNTQNRDGAALQVKLDELIRSSSAEDDFIGIEKLTEAFVGARGGGARPTTPKVQ